MSANELLKQIYSKFYEQKAVLTEGPALTQDPTGEAFDLSLAETELASVISWLMGVEDIQKEPFEHAMNIIREHYMNQPEWKKLLVEYFEYTLQKEREAVQARQANILKEIEDFTKKLLAGETGEA